MAENISHLFIRLVSTFQSIKRTTTEPRVACRYQRSGHESFGALRAINESRVSPRTGFGVPSHSDFEVFSYIVSGELQQSVIIIICIISRIPYPAARFKLTLVNGIPVTSPFSQSDDSTRILKRGNVQLTSAGTNVYHNERAQNEEVHLVEIWSFQALSSVAPSHFIRYAPTLINLYRG